MKALLFFDDWHLSLREGLDRRWGQPQRSAKIELGSHPELSMLRGASNPRYDERRQCYVSYVDCIQKVDDRRFFFRVETDDPAHWPMPIWAAGSGPMWRRTDNVVIDQHQEPLNCFNVLSLTGTPLADRGYFMNLYRYADAGGNERAATAFSDDGLRFEVSKDIDWIPGFSDTGNPTVYDADSDRFLIFCRPNFVDRRIAQVLTEDLKSFLPPTTILQPDSQDPPGREFYGLDPLPYEDMYVGMLSVYDTEPTQMGRQKMYGSSECHLAYSYNGRNWYRADRDAFIPRTEAGSPCGGSVYASAPVRAAGGDLLFHAMGNGVDHGVDGEEDKSEEASQWHTYQYQMRQDGFACLRTRATYGRILTKPLILEGGCLSVNVRTSLSGYLKAAVLDEKTHEPLPRFGMDDAVPISGDEPDGLVHWSERDNLDELTDRPVVLEIQVREAELYALRFSYHLAPGQ